MIFFGLVERVKTMLVLKSARNNEASYRREFGREAVRLPIFIFFCYLSIAKKNKDFCPNKLIFSPIFNWLSVILHSRTVIIYIHVPKITLKYEKV